MKELKQEELHLKLVKDLGMEFDTANSKIKKRFGIFECPMCLKHFRVAVPRIKNRSTTKCGSCSSSMKSTTHGQTNIKGFKQWESMLSRCYKETNSNYHRYGARGISVCNEWKDNPKAYIDYITSLENAFEETYSIDRIDNNLDYKPGNIRWASKQTQAENSTNGTHGASKYKGVTWSKQHTKWVVRLMVSGKRVLIGYYTDEIEAAKAYDAYVQSLSMPNKLTNKEIHGLSI